MIRREVRTGFEWLDTSFLITRILASLWGLLMTVLLFAATLAVVDDVRRRILPPPLRTESAGGDGDAEVISRSCSMVVEEAPYRDLSLLFWFSALPIAGTIQVWRKPRQGFLLLAGGWFMIGLLPWFGPELPKGRVVALAQLPTLWLCFAAWKVRPSPPPSPDLIIPVEDPETGFEWMDAVLEWVLRPFRRIGRPSE